MITRCFSTALLLFLASTATAQSIGVSSCGTVVDDGVCVFVFEADSGGTYVVPGLEQFQLGDRVFVDGLPNFACDPFCAGPAICLIPATISACETGVAICNGDGGDGQGCTTCPCSNDAPANSLGGCINGSGTSAAITAEGNASLANDTLRIEATGANPNTFGVLISEAFALPNNPMNPCPAGSGVTSSVLDGLRCAGGNILRHGTRATDATGSVGVTNAGWGDGPQEIVANSPFVVGQSRVFQVFYREDAMLVCQTGQNTTNALAITIFS